MRTADDIVKELPKGVIYWYDFKENSKVLHVTKAEDAITELLKQRNLQVKTVSTEDLVIEVNKDDTLYDYVVLINQLEVCPNPQEVLKVCRKHMKADGTMLLGVDNRFGLRYFCGDRDPFTNRSFDGVENYRRADVINGRCFSKAEVEEIMEKAGFTDRKFYSVMPSLEYPQLLFAENYLPKENLAIRYFPMYHYPDAVFLEEEYLYSSLIENGMFHAMANSYLIECTLPEQFANVSQVTLTMDRGREDAMVTIIREGDTVEKRAVYKEGKNRLEQLMQNAEQLREHGILTVDAKLENDKYIMPYVNAQVAEIYLRELIYTDKDKFIKEMDHFRELILKSSEVVEETVDDGVILSRAYFDLVPINCFWADGEFVFYDQEFYIENYPANVIVARLVDLIYQDSQKMEPILPRSFFLERYGLSAQIDKWRKMNWEFLNELRKAKELRVFHEKHRRNMEVVHTNRQHMNYSENEYQRLFIDVFEGLENKKLILFGSGNFAKKFVALYGKDYPVYRIVDNSESKWGKELAGITIAPPDSLQELDPNEYKVIVCIKNYLQVLRQLQQMGVKHISIYDTNKAYPRKEVPVVKRMDSPEETPKKYHTGYIAGVFDLFHVGHLNMFKRAKEQCDYLIVGVVSDEGVRKNKKTEPFIPFEERIEMVRSCRYVDEAVEIPFHYGGTRDAYRLYHFDAQFSGSDYIDDPNWLAEKEFLEKQGADLVFFPYTEATSSSKIKRLIEQKLL